MSHFKYKMLFCARASLTYYHYTASGKWSLFLRSLPSSSVGLTVIHTPCPSHCNHPCIANQIMMFIVVAATVVVVPLRPPQAAAAEARRRRRGLDDDEDITKCNCVTRSLHSNNPRLSQQQGSPLWMSHDMAVFLSANTHYTHCGRRLRLPLDWINRDAQQRQADEFTCLPYSGHKLLTWLSFYYTQYKVILTICNKYSWCKTRSSTIDFSLLCFPDISVPERSRARNPLLLRVLNNSVEVRQRERIEWGSEARKMHFCPFSSGRKNCISLLSLSLSLSLSLVVSGFYGLMKLTTGIEMRWKCLKLDD